jgi:glucan phosphoethanolaminetransferase (alkaline phosphatase superfamily)
MELDDLKNTWKRVTEAEKQHYEVSENALHQMIKQQSSSLTDKMLRSFYGEMALVAVCFLIVVFAPLPWYFRLITLVILILLFLPFIKPFVRFYRLLKNFGQHPVEDLHQTLRRQVDMVRQYLQWYRRLNLILTPIVGFGVIWAILYFYWIEKIITEFSTTVLLVTLGLSVGYALLCIPLVNWYINKLYGQYLDKLNACLEELEEKNN